MCTGIVESAPVAGSGKGPRGWFKLEQVNVSFDHPVDAGLEHALNIDFQSELGTRSTGCCRTRSGVCEKVSRHDPRSTIPGRNPSKTIGRGIKRKFKALAMLRTETRISEISTTRRLTLGENLEDSRLKSSVGHGDAKALVIDDRIG